MRFRKKQHVESGDPQVAKQEAAAADYSARHLTRPVEKHDGEFWRRLDVAQKLGVPLHEVPELPPGPPLRWDMLMTSWIRTGRTSAGGSRLNVRSTRSLPTRKVIR